MNKKHLRIGQSVWSYLEDGEGDDLWVTFHGYGQGAEVMEQFMRHFNPNAHGVHFDLPHHGETVLAQEALTPSHLSDLITHLLRESKCSKCSILAYSLGGKVALKLMELMPGKIAKVILIAPDGLKINPLYRFTANTETGKWLYARVIDNPKNLFMAARLLANARLLSRKIEQFMYHQLQTREKRQMVYDVWRTFRLITPDLDDVRSKIHRYHIHTTLVFGKHDRIIHPSLAKRMKSEGSEKIRIIVLERSHNLITSQVAEELKALQC